jgi:hypothetical protein
VEENEPIVPRPTLGWRPTFSIVVGVGWLIFIIAWLGFYASNYVWEQNIAIILLSILVAFSLLGGIWAVWGLKMIPKEGREMFKTLGFKWRIQTSIVIPFLAIVFLIIWFWFYAAPFTVWQNIAVLLITLLAVGGILGALWARWGMKHGWKFDKQAAYYHHEHHKEEEKEEEKEKED